MAESGNRIYQIALEEYRNVRQRRTEHYKACVYGLLCPELMRLLNHEARTKQQIELLKPDNESEQDSLF